MRSTRLSEVPERCLWNVSSVLLIDDGPLSSYLGGSFSASSFNASLLQEINGVVSLTLCQQVVSQVPQHFRSSEKQANCEGCFSSQAICSVASLHAGMSLLFTPACPGQYTHREFWRWMLTIDTFQSGLPIPIWVAQFYTKSRSGWDERLVYWACTRSLFMHRHNQHPRSLTRALHQKVFTSTSWQVAGVDFYSSHPLFVGWLCVRCLKPG